MELSVSSKTLIWMEYLLLLVTFHQFHQYCMLILQWEGRICWTVCTQTSSLSVRLSTLTLRPHLSYANSCILTSFQKQKKKQPIKWQRRRLGLIQAGSLNNTIALEKYTWIVSSYVGKCIDVITPFKTITTHSNQKPSMTAEVRATEGQGHT